VNCKLLEVIHIQNEFTRLDEQLGPLKYLNETGDLLLWEFYQPAIEEILKKDSLQVDLDENCMKTL
jgi:hypothetical protein